MRFKWVVEPPATLDAVADAQRAIPLVPASEADCHRRLVDRTHIDDREEASQWLTFLRALRLVDRTPGGYRRERVDLTTDELVDRLCDGIYGAREIHSVLTDADDPLSVEDLDGVVDLPTWERHHHTDPGKVRQRRLRRLAEWCVLCGVAERTDAGYHMSN
ncbi:hypothetical protein [Halohasta salina]|uniref:hypothetical protein n=1 Tax=Halohasta salina TaxID=2961621 RepID=UPI0020A263EB|nr:hypothetical protein [Halohasta salina]